MLDRQRHQQEVRIFLEKHFESQSWEFSYPKGYGHETYFARSSEQAFFVKLGAQAAIYQAMAAIGLTPRVLAAGFLEDGMSIIVQPHITGRNPSRRDYRNHLEQFASAIHKAHDCLEVKQVLPEVFADSYSEIGLEALARLQQKWERYRALVPEVAGFIDEGLVYLGQQAAGFWGVGLVASHNDICNANWLITPDGQVYLVDLDSMAMDDPAVDIGATLWWYYPPALRQRFLQIAGHAGEQAFEKRMQVRMAMHCLNILLPREQSFDRFDPISFAGNLVDFRAVFAGEENPQGYDD